MSIKFFMCDEKVERLCSMLCSSPMSQYIPSYTDSSLSSAHGTKKPLAAITDVKPTSLRVTVLPPVLGPVISKMSKSLPSLTSIGTTLDGSMSACLPRLMSVTPLSLSFGSVERVARAYLASANALSASASTSASFASPSTHSDARKESAVKIASISFCSSACKARRSLFISTTENGSINNVAPLAERSWMSPGTCTRYSDLTGSTNLPARTVITLSCKYLEFAPDT